MSVDDEATAAPSQGQATAPGRSRFRNLLIPGTIAVIGIAVVLIAFTAGGSSSAKSASASCRPEAPVTTAASRQDLAIEVCVKTINPALHYMLDQGVENNAAYGSVLQEIGYLSYAGRAFADANTAIALDTTSIGAAQIRGRTTTYAQQACSNDYATYGTSTNP